MKLLKNNSVILITFILLSLPTVSYAQDNAHYQAAMELTELTYDPDMFCKGFLYTATIAFGGQINKNPELAKYKEQLIEIFQDVITKAFYEKRNQDLFKQTYAEIYTQEFSITELHEISAFYKTKAGKRLIKKMPVILSKWEQRANQIASSIMSLKYEQMLEERMAELIKSTSVYK
ncbi:MULTISPECIES: DUF2059 domain-containing protein [unclassified Maridesulfovibrio]|uniref:DUF2059 domain-containing protein n=1 Tax=unclassified Maridesulfovibrio TaxID=2794999 RepID=UPI003B3F3DCF